MQSSLRLALSASGLTLCLAGGAVAAPEGWGPLLEPEALADILAAHPEVRVVHVSGDFAAGHIPGAVSAPYPEWRGPPQNPGALRPVEEFGALVRGLGIDADTPVAVVHAGASVTDMGTAARVYWTLRSLGVEDLALVNGGFAAWTEAGLPVATEPVEVTPSAFMPVWDDRLRITTDEVEALLEEGGARLIDARPAGFFEGRVWSIARPGTLPGAGHLSHERWFEGTRMVGSDAAAAIAGESGPEVPITVSFCNTGHWAAINWFALSELAGVENTRLYAESMAEWTAAGRPLDNAPHRVVVYWAMTESWIREIF